MSAPSSSEALPLLILRFCRKEVFSCSNPSIFTASDFTLASRMTRSSVRRFFSSRLSRNCRFFWVMLLSKDCNCPSFLSTLTAFTGDEQRGHRLESTASRIDLIADSSLEPHIPHCPLARLVSTNG